ncbi:ABC transporter permease [Acidisphaera sp. L21]|uniref:ABC transporter permease n=1 Tax=Acidisphaera sp. L21 TaxID=1641851 RepID=UPI00131C1246|nr:ABC transporter permease [Acidisphaera sp. L21]
MHAGRLLAMRLLQVVPIIVVATFVVFGLLHLTPGDPAMMLAGDNPTPQHVAEIRHLYGLDRPFLDQYGLWLWHAAHGDLSQSLLTRAPVSSLILQRLPNTLLIVALALVLGLGFGIPLGIAAAVRNGSAVDQALTSAASLGVALPSFWLAMILVTVFALDLNWFPASGAASLLGAPLDALRHAALPAIALAGSTVAEVARQLRSALIEVLGTQYIRTLRAKGLSPTRILWKHGLKNVAVTLLTVTGLMVNRLLGATVVIEAVFAIPGTGSLISYSAINKDFPVVQGVVFVLVIGVILTNLLVDLVAAALDPRVSRA